MAIPLKDVIAIIATLLAVAGNVQYLRGIIKGVVQPHPYTWLVGAIVSATVFFGMFFKGAGIGALPVATSGFFTIIIFFLSLKYGFRQSTNTDRIFLVVAFLGLIPWAVTQDPTLSVVIAVGIDIASLIPTFRKTWKYPQTEAPALYATNTVRHALTLFSLQTYNMATTLHSIAMIISNAGLLAILFRKRQRGV